MNSRIDACTWGAFILKLVNLSVSAHLGSSSRMIGLVLCAWYKQ